MHCDKLVDWLVDRKRLGGDWRPKLAALRSRGAAAAASLPPELAAGVPVVDGAPAPDYAACVALRDAVEAAAGGAESRGLFGRRGAAAREWDALARAYERDALHLPEAAQVRPARIGLKPCVSAQDGAPALVSCATSHPPARQFLVQATEYEVPLLRKTVQKCHGARSRPKAKCSLTTHARSSPLRPFLLPPPQRSWLRRSAARPTRAPPPRPRPPPCAPPAPSGGFPE